jgi:DNA polymerase-3 subunit alpha
MQNVGYKLGQNHELAPFFRGPGYALTQPNGVTPEELAASEEIAGMCEALSLGNKPLLPDFPCPGGLAADDYLRQLCEEGWVGKVVGRVPPEKHQVYRERLEEELGTLSEFGLSSYFLIVEDYVRYARTVLKSLVEPRGSGGGCLVGYLIGISDADPVRFDLLFARFINRGRMTKEKASLPDYDIDFPIRVREKVISYIRGKYGNDRVASMATIARMQGRAALQDVLRVHGNCTFEEINRITEAIPDESKITDDLQEMLEAYEKGESDHPPSIIRWALENRADALREWCWVTPEGSLDGPFYIHFEQAMRLEGIKRSIGKHASGIVICSRPLADVAPLIGDDRSDMPKIGFDMVSAEECGLVKVDVLGCLCLDRMADAISLVCNGVSLDELE